MADLRMHAICFCTSSRQRQLLPRIPAEPMVGGRTILLSRPTNVVHDGDHGDSGGARVSDGRVPLREPFDHDNKAVEQKPSEFREFLDQSEYKTPLTPRERDRERDIAPTDAVEWLQCYMSYLSRQQQ